MAVRDMELFVAMSRESFSSSGRALQLERSQRRSADDRTLLSTLATALASDKRDTRSATPNPALPSPKRMRLDDGTGAFPL
jgi:hypothetical protein